MTDTPSPVLLDVEPNSITMIFELDPALLANPDGTPSVDGAKDLDRLIAELRRRADVNAAALAAEAAAPKTATGRKRKSDPLIDAAMASIADKPVEELSLDDLGVPDLSGNP